MNQRVALIVSASLHAAVLLWSVVTFTINPFETGQVEALPVDIISDADFTKITAGVKTAPKAETPKPLVEKVDKAQPTDEVTPNVTEKQEIKTASAMPVPIPEMRPPRPKPEKAKAEPKPEPDPIAEALKKEEKKRKAEEKKREEEKRKEEARKQEEKRKEQVFDPNRIAALLDKRKPQRHAAVGDTLNNTASLGLPTGRAATLTQTEIDALRAQIQACWNPPAGTLDAKDLIVVVRLQLREDGSLSADPALMNRGSHPIFRIAAESAMRAIRRCQPYKLPLAKYQVWRDVEVTFDPRDMFRG
ncbi:MAG: cell envelope biogenesis protein TolA [Xanthobacteraceae bacterium]